jgi:phage gpG-like protein
MSETKITADLSKLEDILKGLGGEYYARVGLLGADGSAPHDHKSDLTNAELGLIHEFGSFEADIRARSFLRMPLETKQDELVQAMGSGLVKEAINKGDTKKVYKILGMAAEGIVKDAFRTSGYGQWPPNTPETIAKKGSSKPLIDEGTLMASVTSDVVKRSEL